MATSRRSSDRLAGPVAGPGGGALCGNGAVVEFFLGVSLSAGRSGWSRLRVSGSVCASRRFRREVPLPTAATPSRHAVTGGARAGPGVLRLPSRADQLDGQASLAESEGHLGCVRVAWPVCPHAVQQQWSQVTRLAASCSHTGHRSARCVRPPPCPPATGTCSRVGGELGELAPARTRYGTVQPGLGDHVGPGGRERAGRRPGHVGDRELFEGDLVEGVHQASRQLVVEVLAGVGWRVSGEVPVSWQRETSHRWRCGRRFSSRARPATGRRCSAPGTCPAPLGCRPE